MRVKKYNDSKGFIEYFADIDNIYKNIEERNPDNEHKILIVFDNMIAYRLSNKKLNLLVTHNPKQEPYANPKAIQQINFTGILDQAGNMTMLFIVEEAK